jgi:hypothetical protein
LEFVLDFVGFHFRYHSATNFTDSYGFLRLLIKIGALPVLRGELRNTLILQRKVGNEKKQNRV